MDRFEWVESDTERIEEEVFVFKQTGVKIYDGSERTSFENGCLTLTTYRLIWDDEKQNRKISLFLRYVVYVEEEVGRFNKSPKIVLHLAPKVDGTAGPSRVSTHSYVRLSFKESGEVLFHQYLNETLNKKLWEVKSQAQVKPRQVRTGIVGIERNLQAKQKATDKKIQDAFEDLNQLIELAKPMVELAKSTANKIREKQGDVTDDETVKYKSYLLSMGISNPVTRETHGSGTAYHMELARQLAGVLVRPISDVGGIMTLTDAYCIINRARGMELLSPQDMVNACKYMENMHLDIRMKKFSTGVLVLQLRSHDEANELENTIALLASEKCLAADELATLANISVLLAKERLLLAEEKGKACRDDTVDGLRFYGNLFLE